MGAGIRADLDVFLNPFSVAVIGATERQGSWGSFIVEALQSQPYAGRVHVVNHRAERIHGIPAHKDVREIEGDVALAIIVTPEESVEEVVKACGEKRVQGLVIITAGFGEVSRQGSDRGKELAALARSYDMRVVGPNVSGVFNLHTHFNASGNPIHHMLPSALAAVSQGGYAFGDILASGYYRGMGVGQFVHTGNECDLTVTDFVEYFGRQPDVKGILMYVETLRDGRRFVEIAREVGQLKPIVVYKGGKTNNSARAAMSHTGAMSGAGELYDGIWKQLGIVNSPSLEMLLPIGHALIERPPMVGPRVAIVTMGGSWGVALTDSLEQQGLLVPEFGSALKARLRGLGLPTRASTRNPVDIGASGLFRDVDLMTAIGKEIVLSGEADALILHGLGRAGRTREGDHLDRGASLVDIQERIIQEYTALEKGGNVPVFIGTHFSPWESEAIYELNQTGIRTYDRVGELARLISCVHTYWHGRRR